MSEIKEQLISQFPWWQQAYAIHAKTFGCEGGIGNPWNTEARRFLALALCGETGELANKIKKAWRGDKEDYEGIHKEICDCFVYLSLLAFAYDMDNIARPISEKLNEYERRMTTPKDEGGGS